MMAFGYEDGLLDITIVYIYSTINLRFSMVIVEYGIVQVLRLL